MAGASADKQNVATMDAKAFVYTLGFFVLCMLVMIPFWNAVLMPRDLIVQHFIGNEIPVALANVCCGVVALYLVSMCLFFLLSSPMVQTEQTILMIGNIFIVMLGTAFILISLPLGTAAVTSSSSLFMYCGDGVAPGSFPIYETSQALQALRATPSCRQEITVEDCSGYKATQYTALLKDMEQRLKCSGFCYNPTAFDALRHNQVANKSSSTDSKASLVQSAASSGAVVQRSRSNAYHGRIGLTSKVFRHGVGVVLGTDGMQSVDAAPASLAQLEGSTSAHVGSPNHAAASFVPYPPTLFSQADFQASCDGMAARHLQYTAGDTANQLFYEGIFLTSTSVMVGLLKLLGMCSWDKRMS